MQYEYKVITMSNGAFSGSFNPQKLQDVLNDHASRGWMLKEMVTAETRPGIGKMRQEVVIVLQRSV